MGWLKQCDVPSGEKVDEHPRGFRISHACGYDGVGGSVNWSPGTAPLRRLAYESTEAFLR
jgi:hypothetical protein